MPKLGLASSSIIRPRTESHSAWTASCGNRCSALVICSFHDLCRALLPLQRPSFCACRAPQTASHSPTPFHIWPSIPLIPSFSLPPSLPPSQHTQYTTPQHTKESYGEPKQRLLWRASRPKKGPPARRHPRGLEADCGARLPWRGQA